MDRQKKAGIILIIIGLFISLGALPFVSGWSDKKGFIDNFLDVGVQIREEKAEAPAPKTAQNSKLKDNKILSLNLTPSKIPFRYFLAVTFILAFIGYVKIDSSRKKNSPS